jgi:hypothetical protein
MKHMISQSKIGDLSIIGIEKSYQYLSTVLKSCGEEIESEKHQTESKVGEEIA